MLSDVIDAPRDIDTGLPGTWSGFTGAGFGSDIDSCVPWYDGKAHFLKGSKYLIYDMIAGAMIGGPRDIDPAWVGLAAVGFGDGIRAGFCAPPPPA